MALNGRLKREGERENECEPKTYREVELCYFCYSPHTHTLHCYWLLAEHDPSTPDHPRARRSEIKFNLMKNENVFNMNVWLQRHRVLI